MTKGKSMIAEEIALNDYLEANGITPVETDLGEYIIQLRHEPPSHIIAPAIHLVKEQVAESFRATHTDLDPAARARRARRRSSPRRARILRQKVPRRRCRHHRRQFPASPRPARRVIVTNEGNGDLTQTLPKAHIVLASIEKLVPTLEDVATILRLLARSATGQEFSTYTTFSTGPAPADDTDGPGEYHVVLLDNGRSAMLGTEFQDMLRCIRCARLPQPLPGLCHGRRPRLWLGLSGTDGRGADADADRRSRRRAICPTPRPSADAARASAR